MWRMEPDKIPLEFFFLGRPPSSRRPQSSLKQARSMVFRYCACAVLNTFFPTCIGADSAIISECQHVYLVSQYILEGGAQLVISRAFWLGAVLVAACLGVFWSLKASYLQ